MDDRFTLSETVRTWLRPGERLLWSGRARQGLVFRYQEAAALAFGAAWLVLFLWLIGGMPNDPILLVYIVPIGGFPLASAIGRVASDSYQRKRTIYGVTDRRVLIRSGVFLGTIRSLELRTLAGVTTDERSDGGGVITFSPPKDKFDEFFSEFVKPTADGPPAFILDHEVREVAEIISRAQATSKEALPTT